MTPIKRVRPRIGDIVEILTPQGYAYAQFTHKHERYGSLIRVLQGLYLQRPVDFNELLKLHLSFSTFFPLGADCSRKIVSIVATEPIPEHTASFPIFRSFNRNKSGERVAPWWLWDGEREWKVEELSEEQIRDYPPLGIWNDTLLIERIVEGWKHEDDS
jgi:hypothetical protein